MRHHRSRSLALLAALAIPTLLAACTSGGGSSSIPTIPAATPVASTEASAASSAPASAEASAPGQSGVAGCPTSQPEPLAAGDKRTVTVETSLGNVVMDIDGSLSPIATGNFVALAECGWYDGVVFHRVVPGFVIQGGDGQYGRTPNVDPNLVGTGGPPYTITDEPVTTPYKRGTVAMARTAEPNSVGSQFFVVLDDAAAGSLGAPEYNNYQIIGEVSAGMDVVDAIAAAADQENPTNPVVMNKVTVSTP